jgi:hypothetical protein
MPTYTAYFRTDADFAEREFEANTPKAALQMAREFLVTSAEDLIFEAYDFGMPVNEIAIMAVRDKGFREVAVWRDDDLCVRLAAGELLSALELCADCLADLGRLDDGTPSISALNQARAAIAKAKGGRP